MLWFRVYNEMRNDTKLRLIATALDTEEAFVHGMWTDLLCLAAELDQDWRLRIDEGLDLTFEQVAAEVRVKRVTGGVTAVTFVAAAIEYGLVGRDSDGLYIASGKRRNAKPSDSRKAVSERVRRHRDAKNGTKPVTRFTDECNAAVTRFVTPQEVEVEEEQELKEQELSPLIATQSPPPTPKPPVVKAPTAVDWQARADDLLVGSHFPSDLLQLGEILAGENKTGKAALSRIVRELYEPIVGLQDSLSDEALLYGLRAAITAGAPNWRYVRKAAEGYRPNGSSAAPASNSYQQPLDDYDRAFLTSTADQLDEVNHD
ncbi:MAG TPA: hypothetical protein VIL79_07360 [Thermoleophilia bacterium]